MERRLAAILAADVVDYTRLMAEDQTGTLTALRKLRTKLLRPNVEKRGGNIVKNMGDGWIIEFPSISDAVDAAFAVQADLVEQDRIRLRMGIHTGEVVFEDEDVFGDGVNVASRLEQIAAAGQIIVSDNAYQSLDAKNSARFVGGEAVELKNVSRPITIWRWPEAQKRIHENKQPPPLPDKPSIAVLPFENISGDKEQDYFADGMTDDIIGELSRYDELFVIARHSTFVYRDKSISTQQIANELGVQYILEGGVRRAGNNIRIATHLTDAIAGNQIWSERYDRVIGDIFAVQDEITAVIVNTLVGHLERQQFKRAMAKGADAVNAYDHALRAMVLFQRYTQSENLIAREEATKATALDHNFARAHALIAWTYNSDAAFRWVTDMPGAYSHAYEAAAKAVQLDPEDAWGHSALGFAEIWGSRNHSQGLAALEQSVALSPNNAVFRGWYSGGLCFVGRAADGLNEIELAIRLNPHHPPIYLHWLARILFTLERYEDALATIENVVYAMPENTNAMALAAACYAAAGQEKNAKDAIRRALQIAPEMNTKNVWHATPYQRQEDMDLYLKWLSIAGLPE